MILTYDGQMFADMVYYSIIRDLLIKMVPENTNNDFVLALSDLQDYGNNEISADYGAAFYQRQTTDDKNPRLIVTVMKVPDKVYITLNGIDPDALIEVEVNSGNLHVLGINLDKLDDEKKESAKFIFDIVRDTLISLTKRIVG